MERPATSDFPRLDDLRGRLASLAMLLNSSDKPGSSAAPAAGGGDEAGEPPAAGFPRPQQRTSPKASFKTAIPPAKSALLQASNRDPGAATLSSALARLREAEAGWARERGQLRLDLQHAQRRAQKLEGELRRTKEKLAFRVGEVKHLKTALKERDCRLAKAGDRLRELEAADSADRLSHEEVAAAQAERDELREALRAMLARLEETNGLLGQADATFHSMGTQLSEAEEGRQAAEHEAARAREEAAAAQHEVEDLRWRVSLLQQLTDVTVRQNEEQAATLRELLESEALLDAGEQAGGGE